MGSQGGMSGERQAPGNLETTRQSNTSGNITPQKMEEAPEGAPQGGEMPEGMPPEGQLPENDLPVQENSGEPPEKPGGFGEGEANSGNSTSGESSSESDDLAEKAGSESSASAQPETDTQEESTPPGCPTCPLETMISVGYRGKTPRRRKPLPLWKPAFFWELPPCFCFSACFSRNFTDNGARTADITSNKE
jgi:hypothetical protein